MGIAVQWGINCGKLSDEINNEPVNYVTTSGSALRRTFNLPCAGYQTRHRCCVVYRSVVRRSHSVTRATPALMRFPLTNRFVVFVVWREVVYRLHRLTGVAFTRRHRCCLYAIVSFMCPFNPPCKKCRIVTKPRDICAVPQCGECNQYRYGSI